MTDREIIENILEQKAMFLRIVLLSTPNYWSLPAMTKIKKSIYVLERRKILILIIFHVSFTIQPSAFITCDYPFFLHVREFSFKIGKTELIYMAESGFVDVAFTKVYSQFD